MKVTLLATLLLAQPALADGYFLQGDLGRENRSVVGALSQGPLTYDMALTDYGTGKSGSASVTYAIPLKAPAVIKIGPAVGVLDDDDDERDVETGVKLSMERYAATGFGSVYVMGNASTVHQSWFLLGQVTFAPSNVGIELSRGGSETYRETTVTVQNRLGDGPLSLRAGYKIDAEQMFVGLSINTF